MPNEYRARIYRLARLIPKGRVMTYGQIAVILDGLYPNGSVYTAQTVGWAMHALGDTALPHKGGYRSTYEASDSFASKSSFERVFQPNLNRNPPPSVFSLTF